MKMSIAILAIALWAISGVTIYAQNEKAANGSLEGKWQGETALGPRQLTFEASFKYEDSWSGTMHLAGITTRALPLKDISVEGEAVSFRLPAAMSLSSPAPANAGSPGNAGGGGLLFSGILSDGEINGTMSAGLLKSDMHMSRK